MSKQNGYKIVLTASDVEMSNYRDNPFLAFSGAFSYRMPLWTTKNVIWRTVPLNKDNISSRKKYTRKKTDRELNVCY